MNKTVIKISMLVVAMLVAVGGVLLFVKTIVSPPEAAQTTDQFTTAVEADIKGIGTNNASVMDPSQSFAIIDEITLFLKEHLIDKSERDKLVTDYADKYTPAFIDYCDGKFKGANWSAADHKQMLDRIASLSALSIQNGTKMAVADDDLKDLSRIKSTINTYNAAVVASHAGGFSGVAGARAAIANAGKYAGMDVLQPCTSLIAALKAVPSRVEAAHFSYLSGLVGNLAGYRHYSQSSYEAYSNQVLAKLNEYNSVASGLYHTKRSTGGLKAEASRYYSMAQDYFSGNGGSGEESDGYEEASSSSSKKKSSSRKMTQEEAIQDALDQMQ